MRRLQRLTDSKSRIASSRKVRAIRWVHVEDISTSIGTSGSTRPATTGDAYPRANKIHNTEKSGYGLLLRSVPSTKPGGRSTMLSRMDGSVSRSAAAGTGTETEGDDGGFVATEWEPQVRGQQGLADRRQRGRGGRPPRWRRELPAAAAGQARLIAWRTCMVAG